jgi:glycosyltransferase involved in cell wall biosynthesis
MTKLISILAPCFNEAENIEELYSRIIKVTDPIDKYRFEMLFIDNSSNDDTVLILKKIASIDKRVKIIVNTRNFGHLRSPYWGLLQTSGAAIIAMASDLQDPPEYIPQFLSEWEKGWKLVLATKPVSFTSPLMHLVRRMYYKILASISSIELIQDTTGFGLYDREVVEQIRKVGDPYPYIRGLISEFGYPITTITFEQPRRKAGISKSNFYSLFDLAMLGIVSHSKVPIRLATFVGLFLSFSCFLAATYYLLMKLFFWNSFPIGVAPLVIGFFLVIAILFILIGFLGEYIGAIHAQLLNRPIVVEKERVNFD